jgi:hypothetical protein
MQGLCPERGREKTRAQAYPWEVKFKLSVSTAGEFGAEKIRPFTYLVDITAI